jgi:FKBP-type peptidyl-prolyl cis-trans isomerase 2
MSATRETIICGIETSIEHTLEQLAELGDDVTIDVNAPVALQQLAYKEYIRGLRTALALVKEVVH